MERTLFLSNREFITGIDNNPIIRDGISNDLLSIDHTHKRHNKMQMENYTSTSKTFTTSRMTISSREPVKTFNNPTLAATPKRKEPQEGVLGVKLTTVKEKHENGKCKPKQHIGFVKVHKAGSTSMHIMLYRYALENNLTPMLFIRDPFPFARFEDHLLQFPNKSTLHNFDMMVEHSK